MNLGVRRREIRYPATAGVNLGGRVWPKRSPSPRDRGCWTARPDIDSAWISLPPPHRFTPLRPRERFPPLSIRFSPGAQWRRSPRKTGSWDLASFAFVHVSTEKTKQRHVDRHNRGEDRPASAATVADPTTTLTGPFHQLRLALLSVVERMRSTPPDRGLYREALALALGSHRTFRHGGKTVHRREVRHCARAMYFHRTAGFIVEGQTIAAIAAEIFPLACTSSCATRHRHALFGQRSPRWLNGSDPPNVRHTWSCTASSKLRPSNPPGRSRVTRTSQAMGASVLG